MNKNMSSLEQIKNLREKTGAGVVDVKKALEEAGGDEAKAMEIIRKKGQAKALKKSERKAGEGLVVSYVHSNGKIGVLLKLLCETDFVAKTDDFKDLGKDIAMHIAAMNPQCLKPEDFSSEMVEKEKEIWKATLENEGKKGEMIPRMLEGKEKKMREEAALLTQKFVKNPDQTINDLIAEKIGKIGENIQVGEFCRFEL